MHESLSVCLVLPGGKYRPRTALSIEWMARWSDGDCSVRKAATVHAIRLSPCVQRRRRAGRQIAGKQELMKEHLFARWWRALGRKKAPAQLNPTEALVPVTPAAPAPRQQLNAALKGLNDEFVTLNDKLFELRDALQTLRDALAQLEEANRKRAALQNSAPVRSIDLN